MTTTLKRISVGIVGNQPGLVQMDTNNTTAQCLVPGFINNAQLSSEVKVSPKDFIFTSALDGNSILVPVFGTNGVITLQDIASDVIPPAGFTFQNTWFVAKGGLDTNVGTNMDDPKLTLQGAINAAQLTPAVTGVRKLIVVMDGGTYSNSAGINQLNVDIYAPMAVLANTTFSMSASATTADIGLSGNSLTFGKWLNVTYTDITVAAPTIYNTVTLKVGTVLNSNIHLGTRSCEMIFDVWDFATGIIDSAVNNTNLITYYSFAIDNALTSSGQDSLANITLATWIRVNGFVGETSLQSGSSFIANGSVDLDLKYINSVVVATPVGNINYNISPAFNAQSAIGWETLAVRNGGTGNIRLTTTDGGVNIVSVPNNPETAGDGGWMTIKKIGTNTWFAGGDIQNANFSSAVINIYVSALIGSDVTGDGTLQNPFASFTAAIASAGAPATSTNIVGLDDEFYDENVVIAQPNINIIAPTASLFTSAGDALTISTSGVLHTVSFLQISDSAGNTIVMSGNSTVIANVDFVSGNDISVNDGTLYIRSDSLQVPLTIVGIGTINGLSMTATGVQTPGTGLINVLTPVGTSDSFAILGALVADGLAYPTVDGAAGQSVVTNGAGVLSFATVTGGGIVYTPIAGITQLATPNSAWINDNAALTTVTLPAVMTEGAVVAIQGKGVGGWVLQANAGQTIHYFGVNTSVAGSLSATARYDTVQVVALSANTEWSVTFAGGAGLVVA